MSQPSLFSAICNRDNFYEAWNRVRANLGAPGMDRVSVTDFESNLDENIALLIEIVLQGTYQPLPYLSFTMTKESGALRELKIPAVRDRVVQEALLLRLKPLFEKMFLDCSYAYRPGKSALKAVDRVERTIKKGRHWVVAGDIENFFDNVALSILMPMLAQQIDDPKVLRLIELSIMVPDNSEGKGIPQGAAISPLLANIYLHPLDDTMVRANWCYIRFSDNLVVLCQDNDQARQAYDRASQFLEHQLKLRFNPNKTRIVQAQEGFVFLGYYFDVSGKRPSSPAIEKMKTKIETVINRAAEISDSQLKSKLESIIRGWANYFQMEATDKQKLFTELRQKWEAHSASLPGRILMAALALYFGDRDQARTIVEQAPTQETEDAEIEFQWGVINELADRPQEALDAYNSAFRLQSNHPEAAYRLGLHYLNQGQFERAIRFLQKAVSNNPESAAIHFALATALENHHLSGAAQKAFARAFQLDPKLRKLRPQVTPITSNKQEQAAQQLAPEDVNRFLDLFSAREGVFARQWTDNRGRMGYMPVHQPLSEQQIRLHLAGKETLGIYLLRSDNTVNQIVIDIDVSKQARLEIPAEGLALDKWQEMAHLDAGAIYRLAQKLGIPVYIENSGFKGRHVWLFLAQPVPAADAIAFAKQLIAATGEPPTGLTREIFPREPRVSINALGSMVKLPLGVHKLTNQPCLFLELNGKPYPDQFQLLHSIRPISREQLHQALDQLRSGIPLDQPQDLDLKPAETMIAKCNVLKFLVHKVEKERHLAHIDRLTLLHTLGHLGPAGRYLLHQIIGKTVNYDRRVTERWLKRLKGSPVSCPKIREWQSHITPSVGCYCIFPKTSKSYPTPLLHSDPNFQPPAVSGKRQEETSEARTLTDSGPAVTATEQQPVPTASQDQKPAETKALAKADINKLLEHYIGLRQQSRKLEQEKQAIEQQLQQLFEQHHCDRMELDLGVLRRVKQGAGIQWVVEI